MDQLRTSPESRNKRRYPVKTILAAGLLALSVTVTSGCSKSADCTLPDGQGRYTTSHAPVFSDPGMELDPTMSKLGKLFRARRDKAGYGELKTNTNNGRYNFEVKIPINSEPATDFNADKERPHILLKYQAMERGQDPNLVVIEVHDDPTNLNTQSNSASLELLDAGKNEWEATLSSDELFDALDNPDEEITRHFFDIVAKLIADAARVPEGGAPPEDPAEIAFCPGKSTAAQFSTGGLEMLALTSDS